MFRLPALRLLTRVVLLVGVLVLAGCGGSNASPVPVETPWPTVPGIPVSRPSDIPIEGTAAAITFSPSPITCPSSEAFDATAPLPVSLFSPRGTIVVRLDGRIVYGGPLDFGNLDVGPPGANATAMPAGTLIDADMTLTLFSDPLNGTPSEINRACNSGGYGDNGVAILTPGTHVMEIADGNGALLARGSYTVIAP